MGQGGDKIPNWIFITREMTAKCRKLSVWFCIQSRLICNCLWLGISHLSLSDDNKADTLRISCTGERTVINQNPRILFPSQNCLISMGYNPFKFRMFPVQQPKWKHHKKKSISGSTKMFIPKTAQNSFGRLRIFMRLLSQNNVQRKSFSKTFTLYWTELIKEKCRCTSLWRSEIKKWK